jgi:hypothetical protein
LASRQGRFVDLAGGKRDRAAFAVHLLADMLEKFRANYYAKNSPP